jgi:hypothetical protein
MTTRTIVNVRTGATQVVALTEEEIASADAAAAAQAEERKSRQSVSPRQARLALLAASLLDAVESELAKPENRAERIQWEYALEIRREDPLVSTISAGLGFTKTQTDELFELAVTF